MPHNTVQHLFTGRVWRVGADPWGPAEHALEVFERGALAVDGDGRIAAVGEAAGLLRTHPGAIRIDCGDQIILPGFVDAHLHFPQLDMIGATGETLVGWLRRFTFPAEARFADPEHAHDAAGRLCRALLANGVTAAGIFSSSHRAATEALCEAVVASGLRAAVGKMSMDRNAPEELLTPPERDAQEIEELAAAWDGRAGRLRIALAPRFAPACSEAMLAFHGELRRRHPDLPLMTHLAETAEEIAWVHELFPNDRDYLAVYERHGLVDRRALLGHCVHLSGDAARRIAAAGAVAVHCPTSNLFLGSGLAPVMALADAGCRIALGSDIGAGTSLSPWRTLAAAYEVARLRDRPISPPALFALATAGGADALGMGEETGNLTPGRSADFQVIDWRRCELLAEAFEADASPAEMLGALFFHGDRRIVRRVYAGGRLAWDSDEEEENNAK